MHSTHPLMPTLEPFNLDRALTLVQVAQQIRAPQGGRLNICVVWRWAARGYRCKGWTGPALVLPTVVMGKRRYTMPEWLTHFEAARVKMGERCAAPRQPARARTVRKSMAGHRRAVAALERQGLKVN